MRYKKKGSWGRKHQRCWPAKRRGHLVWAVTKTTWGWMTETLSHIADSQDWLPTVSPITEATHSAIFEATYMFTKCKWVFAVCSSDRAIQFFYLIQLGKQPHIHSSKANHGLIPDERWRIQWEHGVLTSGPPGHSQEYSCYKSFLFKKIRKNLVKSVL